MRIVFQVNACFNLVKFVVTQHRECKICLEFTAKHLHKYIEHGRGPACPVLRALPQQLLWSSPVQTQRLSFEMLTNPVAGENAGHHLKTGSSSDYGSCGRTNVCLSIDLAVSSISFILHAWALSVVCFLSDPCVWLTYV